MFAYNKITDRELISCSSNRLGKGKVKYWYYLVSNSSCTLTPFPSCWLTGLSTTAGSSTLVGFPYSKSTHTRFLATIKNISNYNNKSLNLAVETNLVSITPSKSKWSRKQTYPPGRGIRRRLLIVSRSGRFWLWRSIKQDGKKSRSSIEGSEHKQYRAVIFHFLSDISPATFDIFIK